MNKQHLYGLINPFERIAGLEALLWGLAGMVVSTALSFYSGWHYHGLLHFGPAPNPAWWCYAVEHLRTIAVDRHEPFQLLAAYAETRTDRCEHASGRDHATARIPCRNMAVAGLFCLFDLGTGLDVPGIESVL